MRADVICTQSWESFEANLAAQLVCVPNTGLVVWHVGHEKTTVYCFNNARFNNRIRFFLHMTLEKVNDVLFENSLIYQNSFVFIVFFDNTDAEPFNEQFKARALHDFDQMFPCRKKCIIAENCRFQDFVRAYCVRVSV